MADDWLQRYIVIIAEAENTVAARNVLGNLFSISTGEKKEDEMLIFDKSIRLSANGQEPLSHYGFETAVRVPGLSTALQAFLSSRDAEYFVVANAGSGDFDYQLMEDNQESTLVGQSPWDATPFRMADALAHLGLQVIVPQE